MNLPLPAKRVLQYWSQEKLIEHLNIELQIERHGHEGQFYDSLLEEEAWLVLPMTMFMYLQDEGNIAGLLQQGLTFSEPDRVDTVVGIIEWNIRY